MRGLLRVYAGFVCVCVCVCVLCVCVCLWGGVVHKKLPKVPLNDLESPDVKTEYTIRTNQA